MRSFEDYNSGISLEGKKTGGFVIAGLKLTSLKGCPDKIQGICNLDRNELTTLEYGPTLITGDFTCKMNDLESLKFGPRQVGGAYDCSSNELISLDGAPRTCRSFNCNNNSALTSLEGGPDKILDIFSADDTGIESLEFAPKEAGRIFSVKRCSNLKNPKEQIIQNQIKSDKYMTDDGDFTFDDIKVEFDKISLSKRVTRTSMRTLLGLK